LSSPSTASIKLREADLAGGQGLDALRQSIQVLADTHRARGCIAGHVAFVTHPFG
jgi:hypothetical protein